MLLYSESRSCVASGDATYSESRHDVASVDAIYSGSRSDVANSAVLWRRDEIDESSMDDLSRKLVEDLRCACVPIGTRRCTLHRDSPTSAPGLAHICAGTRPHLRRD